MANEWIESPAARQWAANFEPLGPDATAAEICEATRTAPPGLREELVRSGDLDAAIERVLDGTPLLDLTADNLAGVGAEGLLREGVFLPAFNILAGARETLAHSELRECAERVLTQTGGDRQPFAGTVASRRLPEHIEYVQLHLAAASRQCIACKLLPDDAAVDLP